MYSRKPGLLILILYSYINQLPAYLRSIYNPSTILNFKQITTDTVTLLELNVTRQFKYQRF